MSEVLKEIRKRFSVREYQDKPVESEKLERILEAARIAPSARNMQEWRFIVITEKATREKMVEASNNQKFVGEAPVIITCLSVNRDYVMRCGQVAYPIDLAIAIDHMTIQAVKEGLGTCWIGSFYPDKVREILGIPENIPVVELLTLGYPVQKSIIKKNRLTMENIVAKEKWSPDLLANM